MFTTSAARLLVSLVSRGLGGRPGDELWGGGRTGARGSSPPV